MDVQKIFDIAFKKYGRGKVIVATPLICECECEKENVVILPTGELYCSNCFGYWKV